MSGIINTISSSIATIARGGLGSRVLEGVETFHRPKDLMTLYIKESCPFSRKVRETFSMLDLDAQVYPCPRGGSRYRPQLIQLGGKEQVPFIVDPNSHKQMYESEDIVKYLFREYGPGEEKIPPLMIDPFSTVSSRVATVARPLPWHGFFSVSSRCPDQSLILWGFEACPQSRIVREALDSLELPYIVHNVASGSLKYPEFAQLTHGHATTPFLIDPNTGAQMPDGESIMRYLYDTYQG